MKIAIACPSSAVHSSGNVITARRYARILRGLGQCIVTKPERADLLVALHARKSAAAVRAFRRMRPQGRIVLVLTGTDLHPRLDASAAARQALAAADLLVVLEPLARGRLPSGLRRKCLVIRQSCERPVTRGTPLLGRVLQVGHLRAAKDPLLAARALRGLAGMELLHLGGEWESGWQRRVQAEMRRNPAYHWRGELPPAEVRRELARAWLFVLPSRIEGSSAALIEALCAGVGVLASRATGNCGTLGPRHPGLFAVGDRSALRSLLSRARREPSFVARLERVSRRIANQHALERETEAWQRLLARLKKQEPRGHHGRGG
jgi:glycosyltransferase involved in cell wall biosynthesis